MKVIISDTVEFDCNSINLHDFSIYCQQTFMKIKGLLENEHF